MAKNKRETPQKVTVGNITVKIYSRVRDGKYQKFEIADYSTGARRLRSFSDHEEAMGEAKKIARLMAAGESTAAQIRNSDAASYGRALELLKPTGVSIELAAAHFAEAFKILNGDLIIQAAKDFNRRNPVKREPMTVRKVADELIDIKTKRGVTERYLEDLKGRLKKFATDFGEDINQVTTMRLQAWFDGMSAAPRSVKNYRDTVNTLFKFAEARGYIATGDNPVSATQRVTIRNGDPS